MSHLRYIQVVWALCLLPCTLKAQGGEESAAVGANTAGIGFRQEFNTYQWTANAALAQQFAGRWHVSFAEGFQTSMLRIASEGDRWKDDQQLGVRLAYKWHPSLSLQSQLRSVVFQDRQSGFNNDVQSHSATIGLTYTPATKLHGSINIGPKWDSRSVQNDRGPTFDLALRGNNLEWQGYDNTIEVAMAQDRYERRTNSNLLATYRVNKRFTADAADSLDIYMSNQRRDNYVSMQADVESQREQNKGFRNTLFYKVGEAVHVDLKTFLEFKNVELLQFGETSEDRRRKRNDQRIANDLAIHLLRKKFRGRFDLLYALQEQRYDFSVNGRPFSERTAFVTPDNSSMRLTALLNLFSRYSNDDSTAAYFSVSKYQYDTPDTTNFDDRDELRINSRVSFSHWFNSALRMEILTSVNLYHMVYIFGERSADNNWNRIVLLRPIIDYAPMEKFRLHQSFEVLANYVDYDFIDPMVQTRSYVFRKFAMTDSLEWKPLRRTSFSIDYRLQLEENGQLFWQEWSQNIVAQRTNQWLHFFLRYRIQGQLYLTPGFTIYKRDEWRFTDQIAGQTQVKQKAGTYMSRGPTLNVHYSTRHNLRFYLEATRYRVSVTGQKDYYINNIDLGLRWLY
ncbi:hypothetical protein JXA02_08980 [candidate division KSB1 bacterium]|nr:hypothetical protein [candidate division KSB1 bacterium]RQW04854.1 MAG: hypothetical protein EH222_10615 [candidate division KSB1 bacterium]